MKRLVGTELKKYFKDPDKVTSWWKPEEGPYKFWHEQEFKILDKYVKVEPSWRILDAACGQGRFARYYAKKGARVQALDINPKMLQIARERSEQEGIRGNIDFFEGDVETFSRNEQEFDIVTCMDALDHMDDLNLAIKNLVKPLKKNGLFITTYTSTESFYGFLRDVYTLFAYRSRDAEVDIGKAYTFIEIKEACAAAGIHIEHVFGIGLVMAPQERVRFPLFVNRFFEFLSRLDIGMKPYHADGFFATRCSGVMLIGRRDVRA